MTPVIVNSPPSSRARSRIPRIPSEPGGKRLIAKPFAVVANFQNQVAVLFGEAHVYFARVRVPGHIGQRLLEDAKQCRGGILIDNDFTRGQVQPALHRGARREFRRRRLEGGDKTQIRRESPA